MEVRAGTIETSITGFRMLENILYNFFISSSGTWLGISETGKIAFLTNWRVPVEEPGLV